MDTITHLHASMPHVEKLTDSSMPLLPSEAFPFQALEQYYRADSWQAAQYWNWRFGDATALQMKQLFGMIAVCWSGVRVLLCNVIETDPGEAYRSVSRSFYESFRLVCWSTHSCPLRVPFDHFEFFSF